MKSDLQHALTLKEALDELDKRAAEAVTLVNAERDALAAQMKAEHEGRGSVVSDLNDFMSKATWVAAADVKVNSERSGDGIAITTNWGQSSSPLQMVTSRNGHGTEQLHLVCPRAVANGDYRLVVILLPRKG